ncbi:hypothetical protein D3C87_145620 [compost metagenome]
MKTFLAMSLLLLSSASQADVIKCVFTEPFINTTYNMANSTLTYKDYNGTESTVIKNVSFQIQSAGVFRLVAKHGKVLQTLLLNHQGSDGMSDVTYPFSVKDYSPFMTANRGWGGCDSQLLKRTKEM